MEETPILTVEEVRTWIRAYDNGDTEDLQVNNQIEMLIKVAEGYVKDACGSWYRSTPALLGKSKLMALSLIYDWWENRSFIQETPRMTMQQRQSLQGIILQIQLGNPEVI